MQMDQKSLKQRKCRILIDCCKAGSANTSHYAKADQQPVYLASGFYEWSVPVIPEKLPVASTSPFA